MLAYAASRPALIERRPYPNAMLAIIAAHVAVIAVVMSAKMDLPPIIRVPPIRLIDIKTPPPPPPNPITTHSPTRPINPTVSRPDPHIPTPPVGQNPTTPTGPATNASTLTGAGTVAVIPVLPLPHSIVKFGPELRTPSSEMRPPYPPSKILTEEEAVLKLRLTIDEHGRVVAVDPVGAADRAFLEAARRHLIAHWRYKPATEDGEAISSSTVITLRFQLDG